MEQLIGSIAIGVDFERVQQAGCVLNEPAEDGMVRWHSGVDAGFKGRLEGVLS